MRSCLILTLLMLTACRSAGQSQDSCVRRLRGVFDVGSGTTKLNLSEVAICDGEVRLVRTLDDRSSLSVSLEAAKDADGAIGEAGVASLVAAINTLKASAFATARKLAPAQKEIDFAAAGTHAFRTARNQARVVEALAEIGIPITPLTQAEEAAMGLAGARGATAFCGDRPVVVWDVGGGSQQFTAADGSFRGLSIGSEGFKQKIINTFHLSGEIRCEAKDASANPVGRANVEPGVALAEGIARCQGPLCSLESACVIGVGGLHARSIHQRIVASWPTIQACVCPGQSCRPDPKAYERRAVECLAREYAEKNDCDPAIRGPYAGLSETNLLLIAGFMRALRIESVRIVDVNVGHGLAVDRSRLTFKPQPIP